MGLALEDIRGLLELRALKTPEQCRNVARRLKTRVAAVESKIAELQAFRTQVQTGIRRCERAIAQKKCCPVVVDLGADGRDGQ